MILKKRLLFTSTIIFFLATFGCIPKAYKHLELGTYATGIKTLGLVAPQVEIYSFDADGRHNIIVGWCKKGKENIVNALKNIFDGKGVVTKVLYVNEEDNEEMGRTLTRYKTLSIKSETAAHWYYIGSFEEISNKEGVDALMVVDATDEISSAGREGKRYLIVGINTAIGMIAEACGAGAYVKGPFYVPRQGITAIRIALVDKSGLILWHRGIESEGAYDLRKPDSVEALVELCLKDFPSLGK